LKGISNDLATGWGLTQEQKQLIGTTTTTPPSSLFSSNSIMRPTIAMERKLKLESEMREYYPLTMSRDLEEIITSSDSINKDSTTATTSKIYELTRSQLLPNSQTLIDPTGFSGREVSSKSHIVLPKDTKVKAFRNDRGGGSYPTQSNPNARRKLTTLAGWCFVCKIVKFWFSRPIPKGLF